MDYKFTVRQARLYKGLTIEEMAKMLGMAAPTYSKMENNSKLMTFEIGKKVSKATGVSLEDIIFLGPTEENTENHENA